MPRPNDQFTADNMLHERELLEQQIFDQALASAHAIKDKYWRNLALAEIAFCMVQSGETERPLRIAKGIAWESVQAGVLTEMAFYWRQRGQIDQALNATQSITDKAVRADALTTLLPYVPADLFPQALRVAQNILVPPYRTRVLTEIAPYCAEPLKQELLEQALIASQKMETKCFVQLFSPMFYRFTEQAMQGGHIYWRAVAQAKIAFYLDEPRKQEALDMAFESAMALTDSEWGCHRAGVLVEIAPYFPELRRHQILEQALDWLLNIRDIHFPIRSPGDELAAIVPQLPSDLLTTALRIARLIPHPFSRVKTLLHIAPCYPEPVQKQVLNDLLEETLESSYAWEKWDWPTRPFNDLVSALAQIGEWESALKAVRMPAGPSLQASALIRIAPHLPQELLTQAFQIAQDITDIGCRIIALMELAAFLPELQKQPTLDQALELAPAIESEYARAWALKIGTGVLAQAGQWERAFRMAQTIQEEGVRSIALLKLVSSLVKSGQWEQALPIAQAIPKENIRTRALAEMASCCTSSEMGPMRKQILAAVQTLQEQDNRAAAVALMGAEIPADFLSQAAWNAMVANDPVCSVRALLAVASCFNEPFKQQLTLQKALAAAQRVEDENARARTIKAVVTALAQAGCPERAFQAAQTIKENIFQVMALVGIVSASAQSKKELQS